MSFDSRHEGPYLVATTESLLFFDRLMLVVGDLRVLGHVPTTIGRPKQMRHSQSSEIDAVPSRIWVPNYNCRISELCTRKKKWTIKARVTHKSDMLGWTKTLPSQQQTPRQGKLFTFTLTDAAVDADLPFDSNSKGEGMDSIRVLAYNLVADKFYSLVQEGKVYHISNAQVRIARKDFRSDPSYEYELHLHGQTEIEAVRNTFTVTQWTHTNIYFSVTKLIHPFQSWGSILSPPR